MKISLVNDEPDVAPVVLYTDGSCWPNPGPGGWAVVTQVLGQDRYTAVAHGSDHLTTNIKMEGEALIAAMEYAGTIGQMRLRGIIIRTDSEFWVKVCTEWASTWQANDWRTNGGKPVKNLTLTKRIFGLYQAMESEISLEWVRGHNGEPGNEAADEVAGLAREAEVERIARLKEA